MSTLNHRLATPARRPSPSALLSLMRPNKSLFERQRAMLRKGDMAAASPSGNRTRRNADEYLEQHRESTFFMRIAGDSMRGLGMLDGDLLVVDRAMSAGHGDIIVAVVNGELTVRQLLYTLRDKVLRAANPECTDVVIRPGEEFSIWGVVQWSMHQAEPA